MDNSSMPIEIHDDEARGKSLVLKTPGFEQVIEASPIQVMHASSPAKKNKSHKSSCYGGKVPKNTEWVTPSVTMSTIGLTAPKRIEKVRNFDLPFKIHPTLWSMNALTRRVEHVRFEWAFVLSGPLLASLARLSTLPLIMLPRYSSAFLSSCPLSFFFFSLFLFPFSLFHVIPFFPSQAHAFMCKSVPLVVAKLLGHEKWAEKDTTTHAKVSQETKPAKVELQDVRSKLLDGTKKLASLETNIKDLQREISAKRGELCAA